MKPRFKAFGLSTTALMMSSAVAFAAPEVKIVLPLDRTAYQTNEDIDVAVVRSDTAALEAGNLVMSLTGKDGSKAEFTFAVPAVAVAGSDARQTEILHVNGWLLRPGQYTIDIAVNGANATQPLEVYNHVRKSSFKLVNWGRAVDDNQLPQGEDSFGFNTYYGGYGNDDKANFIRAGVDFIANCVMSGGHQMDLRADADWADPYVTRGGTTRVVRRAMQDRTRPNVPGVHFYDEPGLTWLPDPETGKATPHWVPAQRRAYESAFNATAPDYKKLDVNDPKNVADWTHWAYWKLAFMDSAWKEAQFGVSYVKADYLSLTQAQYGATAFTDGYYYNVVRSLPINSGHGGYDDFGLAYFNPSFTVELARARDMTKPEWYLPTWYGNTPPDRFRLEQYLSFQTNLQGMISPPDLEPAANAAGRQGVIESNQLMGRLGTIFTTMPVTKTQVAMLYSLSDNVHKQIETKGDLQYAHASNQGIHLGFTYLAGKLIQQQFMFVVDEDIIDGSVAADYKAIIVTGVEYLDPKVIRGLERFIKQGGTVLTTGCKVKIEGATDLGVVAEMPDKDLIAQLTADKTMDPVEKGKKMGPLITAGKLFEGSTPLAKVLKPALEKVGVKSIYTSSNPEITATRQAAGDIEYLFAVNATYGKAEGTMLSLQETASTIALDAGPAGGGLYDAVNGGPVAEFKGGNTGEFRFGPGQMRVWARTARPIGSIKIGKVNIIRDLALPEQPITLNFGAVLTDNAGGVLAGSAPLEITVTDPLGQVRYSLNRATKDGAISLTLPLAANDPAGAWKVTVKELLSKTSDTQTFDYKPAADCGALAGAQHRAAFFEGDDQNVFRFFRVNHDVTIVTGTGDYKAAVDRLTKILAPWDVRCKVVSIAEAGKGRTLTADEAPTWIGMDVVKTMPGENPPSVAGFNVQGPVILIGTPEDNVIIKFCAERKFLPYMPSKDVFPGRANGMYAYQRDAVGKGQDSITLIAYDEAGMSEAVGSMYEAVHGLDPITRWVMPDDNSVTPQKEKNTPSMASTGWEATLPDRVIAIRAGGGGVEALSADGTLATIDAKGAVTSTKVVEGAAIAETAKGMAPAASPADPVKMPNRLVKQVIAGTGMTAVIYWGGTVVIADEAGKMKAQQQMPIDVTSAAFVDGQLVVGLANGRVVALNVRADNM